MGYIASQAKTRADVILESPKGDPILSTWQCGLGRTVAWNSDGTNEWTAHFARWDKYPMLWSNIIHYVISDTGLSDDNLEIVKEGSTAKIIYETGEHDKDTVVTGVVSDENGESKEITLDPVKPGRYEASVPSEEVGIYNLSIRKKNGEEILKNYNTAFANQYSPEYQFSESGNELHRFIKQVGGDSITFEDDVWKTDARKVQSKVPLTMFLIIFSMGLLLFDIIIRRFSVDVAKGIRDGFVNVNEKLKGIFVLGERKNKAEKNKLKNDDKENSEEENRNLMTVNEDSDNSVMNNDSNKNNNNGKKDKKDESNSKSGTSEKLDMNTLLQKKKDRSVFHIS